jgi:M6 family metalloprotease-like protein
VLAALLTAVLAVIPSGVLAIPLAGDSIKLTQPDGRTFIAQPGGDEWFNWVGCEGHLLMPNPEGWWTYATLQQESLQASSARVGLDQPLPGTLTLADLPALAANVKRPPEAFAARQQTKSRVSTEPVLVVLVGFQDRSLTTPDSWWSNLFFGSTGATVAEYFGEVSNGNLQLTPANETSGTANDGVVRVLLPTGANNGGNHPNPYAVTGNDNRWITYDALTEADSLVDFSAFDVRSPFGCLTADELHIVIVVAGYEVGYDAYSTPSPAITSHWWSLGFPSGGTTVPAVTADGVSLADWYGCTSGYVQIGELHTDHAAGAGVPCHELGHDMGLPDLYDWTYASHGIGAHGLMGWGGWGKTSADQYRGQTPTHMCAWSKVQMGWVTPTVVTADADCSLYSAGTPPYNVLRINTQDPNQYFLLENRQLTGFDEGLYRWFSASSGGAGGGGLAVWHIDESMADNNDWTHKMVDLEESNTTTLGYGELDYYGTGDPPARQGNRNHYYYAGHLILFASQGLPNSKLYDGRNTYVDVSAVSVAGARMKCYVSVQPDEHAFEWITFLGGEQTDYIKRVAIDPQDNVVVTGNTTSGSFPTTSGAYDTYLEDGYGMFISKFNSCGTLLCSTFLDTPYSALAPGVSELALDNAGQPYICGRAYNNLPVTSGAYDTSYNGAQGSGEQAGDAFIAKFDVDLSNLLYCTYLGGSDSDSGIGLALDSTGNILICGQTKSSNFPCTLGAYGNADVFVTKLSADGSALVYSRLLGVQNGYGYGIAVDSQDNAIVAGTVNTATLPVTTGAIDTTHNGQNDGYVTKLSASGSLDYSTYLGGYNTDYINTVAVDAFGDVYVAGGTQSADFPCTPGVVGPSFNYSGLSSAFAAKFHPTAYSGLTYSTFINGAYSQGVVGMVLDTLGQAHLAGWASDASFHYDARFWVLNGAATALLRTNTFAGSGTDQSLDVAIDSLGAIYIVGQTQSSDFPVTTNAYDTTLGGTQDGFIAKLGWGADVSHLVISAPDGGERWELGQSVSIEWSSYGFASNLDVQLSRNGGSTWETLFEDTNNDGAENWTVSGSVSTDCLLRIRHWSDPTKFDVSNAAFAITSISGDLDGDQDVDVGDAAILSNVLMGTDTDPNHLLQADVNDDGDVNGLDVQSFIDAMLP